MYRISSEEHTALMSTCSWCKNKVSLYDATFTMWIKIRKAICLGDWDSKLIKLSLNSNTISHAIAIAGTKLEDVMYGYELMFMTCSQECNMALGDALKRSIKSGEFKQLGNQ